MQACTTEPNRYYRTNVVLDPSRAFFPYKKFWRGDYRSSIPVILDRRAGFYPRKDDDDCWGPPTTPPTRDLPATQNDLKK